MKLKIKNPVNAYWSYKIYYVPGSGGNDLGLQGYDCKAEDGSTSSCAGCVGSDTGAEPEPGHIFIKEVGPIKNQIVDDYSKILAGCLIGNVNFIDGIKYAEVGSGQVGWGDGPGPTAGSTLDSLETPIKRYAPTSRSFMDGTGATTSPTDKVRISFTLPSIDASVDGQNLREYGLWGGTATATLGTGTLFCIFRPLTEYKGQYFKIIYNIDIEFNDVS